METLYIDKNGYNRFIQTDELYHRYVCRKSHGKIPLLWHVHHIDSNKLNNDLNNLIALPPDVHYEVHNYQRNSGKFFKNREEIKALLYFYQLGIGSKSGLRKLRRDSSEEVEKKRPKRKSKKQKLKEKRDRKKRNKTILFKPRTILRKSN